MSKKRILHLISGLEVGGAETQLLRILPELQKYHENRICCVRGHGPIGAKLEEKGIPVYYLELKNAFDFFAIYRFYKVIKRFSPDILVTYLIHADLYGRILGRLFGIKKIISSKRGALLQWEWLSFFDRLTKSMVNHYLVQTETAKNEWMQKLNLSENKFTIIPNGINTESFHIKIDKNWKRTNLKIKENSFVITCVAKLRRGKGHEVLLKAFESIFNKHRNTVLLLVGDGEREEELKNSIQDYKSRESIHFLGNRNDVPEILDASDLFILPTEKEGMSNAIIEAMCAGIPIITTDIEENREIITSGENGILVSAGNSNDLSSNMEMLMMNKSLREKLGYNAQQEAIKKFCVKEISARLADAYSKV